MNERFLIPSVVAISLHALVFFGFSPGKPPIIYTNVTPAVPNPPVPKDTVQLNWLSNPDDSDPAPKGDPDNARPDQPEITPPDATVDIPMPPTTYSPNAIHDRRMVPTGPMGIPDGIDHVGPVGPNVVRSDLLDNAPRTRAQLAPVYPREARRDGRPGAVLVEFVVDEEGRVLDPHVVQSNDRIFDEPTLRAVAKWRFEPGRKNGRVVRFRMAVPVAYAVTE